MSPARSSATPASMTVSVGSETVSENTRDRDAGGGQRVQRAPDQAGGDHDRIGYHQRPGQPELPQHLGDLAHGAAADQQQARGEAMVALTVVMAVSSRASACMISLTTTVPKTPKAHRWSTGAGIDVSTSGRPAYAPRTAALRSMKVPPRALTGLRDRAERLSWRVLAAGAA